MCYSINMKPLEQRLREKTDVRGESDCWLWRGHRHPSGHGQIGRGRRADGLTYTHIAAWEIASGRKVPPGMCVCHRCDNPPCVNPAHLFLGTKADNTNDMLAKGRHPHGEKASWAKLREKDVERIRAMRADGLTQREIADHLGVSRALVGLILQGKRWPHLART